MNALVSVEVDYIRMTNFFYLLFILTLNSSIYGSTKTEMFKIICLISAVPHSGEICN